jgi:hypothetical protein
MSLPSKPRRSPAEGEFLFELDPEPLEEAVTAYGGIPVFLRAARSLDVGGLANRHLHLKQRQRGFDEASYVESFLVLNALGGECLEDFDRLREDEGLREMLGHEVPSPEAARKFLYQFHDEEKLRQAQSELTAGQVSYIPDESAPLRGLAQVNQDLVQEIGRRCADQRIATVDVDATIIESWKREARPTYQGGKGYQPVLALWAEMDLVVADEFRDGNVPAHAALLPITRRAFQALPATVNEYFFRGDSACWDRELVNWLRDEQRGEGAARTHHVRGQRAHERQTEAAHPASAEGRLEAVSQRQRDGVGVCQHPELLAGGGRPSRRGRAAALRGHSHSQTAGRVI